MFWTFGFQIKVRRDSKELHIVVCVERSLLDRVQQTQYVENGT